jgi:hypothetical protein
VTLTPPRGLGLFRFVDDPATAPQVMQRELAPEAGAAAPAFARSATPTQRGP